MCEKILTLPLQIADEEEAEFKLEVVIAFFGKLTPKAEERLQELRKNWETDKIKISTINHDEIIEDLSLSSPVKQSRPEKIKIKHLPNTQVHTNEWCNALVPAVQFCTLFDEWQMSLFDANVRYYLERSSVNKKIINSIESAAGQKHFHLMNNGICLTCSGWSFSQDTITLHNPQIINGCQTVISLHKGFSKLSADYLRRNFEEKCFIQVRIINTQDADLVNDIVIASNNQNKMEARNLLSNTAIQRRLQNQFNLLNPKWFYQRKDGEFESLKQYKTRGFKTKDYEYHSRKYRILDNEELAKAWMSFIGCSKDASERIRGFESVADGGRYEWLFEKAPLKSHWETVSSGGAVELNDKNFEAFSPSAEQYLLAYVISEFVRANIPSPYENRHECKNRLMANGAIKEKASTEDINKALMEDDEYATNAILSNMKEVVVELFCWVLAKKYGHLSSSTATKILKLSPLRELVSAPDFKLYAKELRVKPELRVPTNILFSIFEFIKESITRWYATHGEDYKGAPRRIRYLHKEETIIKIKSFMLKTIEQTKRPAYEWKAQNTDFISCLPPLPR